MPTSDEFQFDNEDTHIANTGVSLIPLLMGAHWGGIEIDRQHTQPVITLLMIPRTWRHRVEMFACRLLDIPPHRVQIEFGLDQSPPTMCGWTLLCRWTQLMHSTHAFVDTLHDFHTLSEDRKKIVQRVLSRSIDAWARTDASDDLQQMAYVIRMSFLTNLFQFNTSVHTRLDALTVQAAGQPLCVHDPAIIEEVEVPPAQVPQIALSSGDLGSEPAVPEVTSSTAIVPAPGDVRAGSYLPQSIQDRIQAFCDMPDKAASDELDFMLALHQSRITNIHFMPCCIWDREAGIVRVIDSAHANSWVLMDTRGLILAHDHWFAFRLHGNLQNIVHFFGFPRQDPRDRNAFLHAFAAFLRVDMETVSAIYHEYPAPWRMCGFLVLRDLLVSCGFIRFHRSRKRFVSCKVIQSMRFLNRLDVRQYKAGACCPKTNI